MGTERAWRIKVPKPTSAFAHVGPETWVFNEPSVKEARRRALLSSPPFEEIVAGLRDNLSIRSIRTEMMRGWEEKPRPVPQRIVAVLSVQKNEYLVDLFHNSATGIRAQCLSSIELGDIALDYARDMLCSKVIELASRRGSGRITEDGIRGSLGISSAKVWIHQGLWVRRARKAERHLRIALWESQEDSDCEKARTLVRYGSKAPESPAAIDLIGGWRHPTVAVPGKPPGLRARQIHTYGFT